MHSFLYIKLLNAYVIKPYFIRVKLKKLKKDRRLIKYSQ